MEYYIDVKVSLWQRVRLSEDILPLDEAKEYCNNEEVGTIFNDFGADSWDTLIDTEDYLYPKDNNGDATIEIYNEEGILLYTNVENQ